VKDFIYPLFAVPGKKVKREISSMPGVFQMSVDELVRECADIALGIPAVIFFAFRNRRMKSFQCVC
jgi:porphobilinogen synthase